MKTKIIVPKTSFRLTENFLADAFAFLWSDRHASYVQEHVHHYSATGHPASLWEMFRFFWLRFAIWPYDDYDIIQSYISQVLLKLKWILYLFVVGKIWPSGQSAANWPIKMSKIQDWPIIMSKIQARPLDVLVVRVIFFASKLEG